MVSPELLRRYPFFAGLSMEQIVALSKSAEELSVERGHYFFREGEPLDAFYLVLEGRVDLLIGLLERGSRAVAPELAPKARELVVSTSGPGEVFAWSALVPPCVAISSGKAQTPCRAVAFDCGELRARFEDDPRFGFLMTQKAAQVIRDRLRDMHLESLGQADARGLAIGERR